MTARDAVLTRGGAARAHAFGEVLLGLALFALYLLVAMLPEEPRTRLARAHGETLYDIERALRLDVELTLNEWLADQSLVRVLANYEYAITYVASALALLVWLFVRHPDRYRTARTAFVLLNVIALACFALYPVMPPRLMPDLGFVDTVRLGGTWGSWGSPLVEHADRFAALPSLHMAWTLWVGVELARVKAHRSVQAVNTVHIIVTGYVIMATANHFVVDALAAVPLVAVSVYAAERLARPSAERVRAPDAFFLAVETERAPQHTGGVIMLDTSRDPLHRADLIRLVAERMDRLPRFRQRPHGAGRWRRPVWRDQPAVDWDWHVTELRVDGMDGLREVIARVQAEPFPRDRPLWRMLLVRGAEPGRTAVVFLMHHVVADGVGVVAQAAALMEPPQDPAPAGPRRGRVRTALTAAVGTAVGLGQLAIDVAPPARLPAAGTPERRFGTLHLPLDLVRDVSRRHGVRVTDVVLCAVAGALHRAAPPGADGRGTCRVAVPLMMRAPGGAMEGNHTSAVMVDLPIGAMPETARLADIARRCKVLRSGTRALAAWFVMRQAARLMPVPLHARFARAAYSERFLQGIVSSLPGPGGPLRLAGAPLAAVYPVVPLAPGAPLAVAALGVSRELCFGVSLDPGLVDDADALTAAIGAVIDDLRAAAPLAASPPPAPEPPESEPPAPEPPEPEPRLG
ncbi:bifunctional phosphatase PAP2/O-acyltransferase family protein [Actinomadura rifamycini]|uniref:bifunctional phosphatase PAP2/O-acyltransferase family protein n=1 Tax=Actinomadura rifamycini TaxID=31962 RepID=UPI0004205B8D|nr:phosphatase PAP2 family protein [Actinomadura rifamycini]